MMGCVRANVSYDSLIEPFMHQIDQGRNRQPVYNQNEGKQISGGI